MTNDPSSRRRRSVPADQLVRFDELAQAIRAALVELWCFDDGTGDLVLDVLDGPFEQVKLNRDADNVVTSVQLRASEQRGSLLGLGTVGTVLVYMDTEQ